MNVIFILILVSLLLATGFLLGFVWAVRSGQYEDDCTPALRLLLDERHQRKTPRDPSPTEK